MKKHTILFLAANPGGTDRRALDREARSIRAELKGSGHRDRFELETRWAVEPLDLLRALRELRPAVVHFSGHGGQSGVCFQAADGTALLVSTEAFAETFGAAGPSVRLVVLSACYSDAQAEALLAHVDCVVGVGGAIHDDAARSFAIGFYGGLGEHESVAVAYRQGRAAIGLEGLREGDRPQLKVRAGIDADGLVLAAVAPAERLELPCPYPGMRPYSADDAAHFHGRDAEVDELLGRLRAGEREIYVIGPSGSGKSSLVAAGVLPRLARGVPGLGPFLVRSMRPGEHPSAQLGEAFEVRAGEAMAPADAAAALLAHRAPGASVLLVIDQLEELFTLASSDENAQFQAALQSLQAEPRCVVLCALRADFFGAFMESPLWTDRRGRISRLEVSPLRGEALREAIVHPARDLGVNVEPELIERLLADAGTEPGILPLLQETLVQLWDRRRDQLLTLADYRALGDGGRSGLAVALSRRADATLRAMTHAQEAIARRILLRLVSFGEGRSDTRRQQPRSKLRTAGDDAADSDAVLRCLIADRLLTTDEDKEGEARVDLAHEVMISAWSTLAGWIQTRRADEQHRRHLEAAAAQWVRRGRGTGGLLDQAELAEAEVWRRTEIARELGEDSEVSELIAASKTAQDRQKRRSRSLVGAGFIVLIATIAGVARLALLARHQASAAEASRHQSERLLAQSYQETGRQLLLGGHPHEAIPYLVEARKKGETGPALRLLFGAATRALPLTLPLEHRGSVLDAAFSPDGTRIVTVSDDVRRTASGHGAISDDLPFTATPSVTKVARVWSTATGKLIATPLAGLRNVRSAVLSSDGTRVITVSADRTARVWDAITGKLLASPFEHQELGTSVAFSPDGTRVVTAASDHTARVWDAATGKLLAPPFEHQRPVTSVAFSPDGTRVVTASADRTARVWDATTDKTFQHQGPVTHAAFSPDGARIVTASHDKTARVWDVATGKQLAMPLKHWGAVNSAAFAPKGDRVVTASDDTTALIWDVATGEQLAKPLEHYRVVWSAAFSPDGTRVVTASADHTARVWCAATGEPLTKPLEHRDVVWSAAFSPDGTRIVTASADHTARVWDATTGKQLAKLGEHRKDVRSAAFSPDGTRVVTASWDNTAQIWNAATDERLASSVDSSRSLDRQSWEAFTGMLLTRSLTHKGAVRSASFSSDSTRVVTAGEDGTARVWEAATGQLIATLLEHQGAVSSATFSRDGTRVVTASHHAARVWDVASGKLLATFEHRDAVRSAAFSRDGTRIVTTSNDHTARIWVTRLDSRSLEEWIELARQGPFELRRDGVLCPRDTGCD